MHVCVCIHVHMRVCVCVCKCVCASVCVHVCVCMCECVYHLKSFVMPLLLVYSTHFVVNPQLNSKPPSP